MKTFISATVGGMVGGLLVLVVLQLLIAIPLRNGTADFISFSVSAGKVYRDIEVVDQELREGGIWVRYRNRGGQLAEMPQFQLKQFRDGKLEDETTLWGIAIDSEDEGELVLELTDEQGEPIDLAGSEFEIRFLSASIE